MRAGAPLARNLLATLRGQTPRMQAAHGVPDQHGRRGQPRDRVTEVLDESIRVIACENTMATVGLKRDDMLGGVDFVKTGLAHIMQRELEGWAYARP